MIASAIGGSGGAEWRRERECSMWRRYSSLACPLQRTRPQEAALPLQRAPHLEEVEAAERRQDDEREADKDARDDAPVDREDEACGADGAELHKKGGEDPQSFPAAAAGGAPPTHLNERRRGERHDGRLRGAGSPGGHNRDDELLQWGKGQAQCKSSDAAGSEASRSMRAWLLSAALAKA